MKKISNAVTMKSKTINSNALYLAVISALPVFGYTPPVEVVAAGQTILNIVLRFFTNTPLEDK